MEQYIYDKTNGLWYERDGDYYIPCLKLPETNMGIWGERYLTYIREHKKLLHANPHIVPRLRDILLGDTKAPAYKAARTKPKEERTWNIDMDKVRERIPAEIPDEEMEDYTAEALRVYHDYLQKKKARDAR